jgi:pimeloyl-ACP methyl ester carboxylesterase
MASAPTPYRAPNPMLLALEGRAPWELGASLAAWPVLRHAPRGDGHAVIVFPGLATTDASMWPLRTFLADRGWVPHGWEQRFNLGPREGVIERCLERVRAIRRSSGRKVSLVGWSLGGVYAREIAKLVPNDVRCVVTIASPFTGHPRANNLWRLYELASGHRLADDDARFRGLREAPPVPTSSVFSRSDGIVAWGCCVQEKARRAESIEVAASHLGISWNPATWYAVADRLAQDTRRWSPFHLDGWRRWVYADPYRREG